MTAPSVLGPFRLLRPLGRGGAGEVWLARHEGSGQEVAIKVLTEAWARQPASVVAFRREVRAVARLDHEVWPLGSPRRARGGGPNGLLPADAQSGSGAVDPLLGLFYAHFADPWSFFATATVSIPAAVRFADVPGPSLWATTAVQYRFDALTLRLGVDLRLDAPVTVGRRTDPRSDHLSLFLSPDLLWSPATDWTVQLGVRVPFLQVSEQGREEGWYLRAAVTLDVS